VNEDRTGPFPAGQDQRHFNPQWLHQQLTTSAEYRLRFSDRVYRHFNNSGVLTPQASIERLLQRKAVIDNAIIAESARWGDVLRGEPYTRDVDWLNEINQLVDDYFPNRTDIVLDQFIDKGWYPTIAPPELNSEGGVVDKGFQLTMTSNRGKVYYSTDGIDPHNPHAQGGLMLTPLVTASASKRVLVPTSDVSSSWRSTVAFDDSDWDLCNGAPGGIGYEKDTGYESYITLDVAKYMHQDNAANPNASCLVRVPFTISSENLAKLSALKLGVRYDDGFIAYINGTKVVEMNAPSDPQWNSLAPDNHEAQQMETFDISPYLNQLRSGQNLLAIQALNVSLGSSDFIIMAELNGGIIEAGGELTSSSALEYTTPITISKTTRVLARTLYNGQWSAVRDITLAVTEDLSAMKITELHYHPLPTIVGTDTTDGDLYEFLEIKNLGGASINLTGAAFTKGVSYSFPTQASLAANQYIILCSSAEHFKQRYGFDADGQYTGNLSNGGERVVMTAATGDTIISVKYNDKAPWPLEADSTGQSLVSKLARPSGDPDNPAYWTVSAKIHGSPRADDSASPVQEQSETTPKVFRLYNSYPNPFNAVTTIKFDLVKETRLQLMIYNALGQQVAELIDQRLQPGQHIAVWQADQFSSGIYVACLRTEEFSQSVKLLLLK